MGLFYVISVFAVLRLIPSFIGAFKKDLQTAATLIPHQTSHASAKSQEKKSVVMILFKHFVILVGQTRPSMQIKTTECRRASRY